jgi:hypothetical protein
LELVNDQMIEKMMQITNTPTAVAIIGIVPRIDWTLNFLRVRGLCAAAAPAKPVAARSPGSAIWVMVTPRVVETTGTGSPAHPDTPKKKPGGAFGTARTS